jgi:hypothetical protein
MPKNTNPRLTAEEYRKIFGDTNTKAISAQISTKLIELNTATTLVDAIGKLEQYEASIRNMNTVFDSITNNLTNISKQDVINFQEDILGDMLAGEDMSEETKAEIKAIAGGATLALASTGAITGLSATISGAIAGAIGVASLGAAATATLATGLAGLIVVGIVYLVSLFTPNRPRNEIKPERIQYMRKVATIFEAEIDFNAIMNNTDRSKSYYRAGQAAAQLNDIVFQSDYFTKLPQVRFKTSDLQGRTPDLVNNQRQYIEEFGQGSKVQGNSHPDFFYRNVFNSTYDKLKRLENTIDNPKRLELEKSEDGRQTIIDIRSGKTKTAILAALGLIVAKKVV